MFSTVELVIMILLAEVLVWDVITRMIKLIACYILAKYGTKEEFQEVLLGNKKKEDQNEEKSIRS